MFRFYATVTKVVFHAWDHTLKTLVMLHYHWPEMNESFPKLANVMVFVYQQLPIFMVVMFQLSHVLFQVQFNFGNSTNH